MNFLKYTLLSFFALSIFACSSSEEDEVTPDNVIKDDSGLFVELEWTTGGSATQAQDDADLELYLFKGSEEIDSSEGYSFEQVELKDIYADGKYLIKVEYFLGEKAVDYTLFVRGGSSSESITFNSSFLATDAGVIVEYLEIQKSGDEYSIVDL